MMRVLGYILILCGMAALSGCRQKEIVCPGNDPHRVDVMFMWDNAPGAEVDGMAVYFYPLDNGGRMWRFNIAGRDGGAVELPLGRYRMLAVNNDLPGITFSDQTSFDGFIASARRVGPAGADGVVGSTGMLYGGCVKDIDVTICGVTYTMNDGAVKECPFGLIRCYPDSLATVYNVTLGDVIGMERVRSASATLCGVASTLSVATGASGETACSIGLGLSADEERTSLSGCTMGLGTPRGVPSFELIVTVTCTDGHVVQKSFDVTGQILASRTPHNVFIRIDGLEIPEVDPDTPPGDDDVGMIVGVDGWQVIEIDYSTGV